MLLFDIPTFCPNSCWVSPLEFLSSLSLLLNLVKNNHLVLYCTLFVN
nr:MAG TPA: hypothetical protein [Caudoviricetes sp.]